MRLFIDVSLNQDSRQSNANLQDLSSGLALALSNLLQNFVVGERRVGGAKA